MKRISVALASIFAVLAVGTATARVPDARQAVPEFRPPPASDGLVAPVPARSPAVPSTPDVTDPDPTGVLPDVGLAGLPPAVLQLLDALPFAGAGLDETAEQTLGPEAVEAPLATAAPTEALRPAPAQAAKPAPKAKQAPKAKPAPKAKAAPAARPAAAPLASKAAGPRLAQVSGGGLFPGLPASGHAGYSTGTVIHADTLAGGGTTLTDVEVAFSGSTFTSAPLTSALSNEVDRVFAPALGANNAFGRGSGLEIGLVQGVGAENQIVLANKAEAKAPPSTTLVSNEIGPVDAAPVVVASLLRGQAQALAAAACTTGVDLAYGQGYAANVGLLGNAIETIADDPLRSVSQSTSRTRLVEQEGNTGPIAKFGLMSETRQTIAPVTVGPLHFEFLGEWVLRATADGKTGSVFYGPENVDPETRLITITGGPEPINVTTQQLLGDEGLTISVPGVATIVIGEDARAIGGDAESSATETATLAAGAVDVVRVELAGGDLADVRIGHMEAAVAVPAGGIECGIGLLKKADPEVVRAGEQFTWTVTVSNPNDCVLTKLKVVDTITTTPGIKYSIISSEPKADSMTASSLTWNDIGPLQPGQKKDLLIRMQVAPDSAGGRFTDEALATGVCGPAAGTAGAEAAQGVDLSARVSLNLPEVTAILGEPLRGLLPRTGGGLLSALPAVLLTGVGLVLRGVSRRRRLPGD